MRAAGNTPNTLPKEERSGMPRAPGEIRMDLQVSDHPEVEETIYVIMFVCECHDSNTDVPNLWYAYPWGYAKDQLGEYANSKLVMADTRKDKGFKKLQNFVSPKSCEK
ncbi:hypothetical protein AVEN_37386-1 [Araneus ventricosus]|uniref:Uncharacterized protein n=1 Tax=Araneus ventricosus TaxID=182803 RepID=A0A4Y2LHC7_ARAVE|nr:hypothetical protein AVEN_37386-1 [Araneus ventricosus]